MLKHKKKWWLGFGTSSRDKCKIYKEGTAEGCLGLKVTLDNSKTTLSQQGLTKRIVDTLGLSSKYSTSVSTPAKKAPLAQDLDGAKATKSFSYPSVIGILHYLNHTRPDCAFAIHQCAWYTFEPKALHEAAANTVVDTWKAQWINALF